MTRDDHPIRIAFTLGDPAGIGPEVVLKAMSLLSGRFEGGEATPLLVGSPASLEAAQTLLGEPLEITRAELVRWPQISFVPVAREEPQPAYGRVSAAAGRVAYDAVLAAVHLAMDGSVGAIVTAPVSKEAINLTGIPFIGHTEMIAAAVGAKESCMMLAHGNLYVSHVTTHVPLSKVQEQATEERIYSVITMTHEGLSRMGLSQPRIGVCGLNPHCGEGGLLGTEDREIVEPAVMRAFESGIDVRGPIPGDTIFPRALGGEFDAVVAMYHDQGHIPVKILGFSVNRATGHWESVSGVNVTLGLPIVRTSVDHGTAFDIAGRGIANAQSMVDAAEFAIRMAMSRRK